MFATCIVLLSVPARVFAASQKSPFSEHMGFLLGLLALSAAGGTLAVRRIVTRVRQRVLPSRRYVIIGEGRRAETVARLLLQRTSPEAITVVTPGRERPRWVPRGATWRYGLDHLAELSPGTDDRVILALDDLRCRLPLDELLRIRVGGIPVYEAARFIEEQARCIEIDFVRPSDLLFCGGFVRSRVRLVAKRALDIMFSLLLLALGAPLFLLIPLAIWLESGGPVLFRQVRIGLGGHPFEILKFRSMVHDAEPDGRPRLASVDDPRVTRVGRILRHFRLDELPQLFNVLRGDMSFVGPRPERPAFARRYEETIPFYSLRSSVRPGLTGWAQVQYGYGANDQETREKLKYDLYYVKHLGPLFDLEIVLRTIRVVLRGTGAR